MWWIEGHGRVEFSHRFLLPPDPFSVRAGLRHRPRAYVPLLLPVAQGEGDVGLFRRDHRRAPRLARHRDDRGVLRLRRPLQRVLPRRHQLPAADTGHRANTQPARHQHGKFPPPLI